MQPRQEIFIVKISTLTLLTLAIASCSTSSKPDFTEMTQAELDTYNRTVAQEDRVYCAEVQPHPAIRRTEYLCVTAKDIERESADSAYRQSRRSEERPRYTGPLTSLD